MRSLRTASLLLSIGILLAVADGRWQEEEEVNKRPSFTVGKNTFLRDGQPFQLISGTIHYWRHLPEYWEDTFSKMRAAGLNALQTYINWNMHEPEPEEYTFEGVLDIRKYFQLAQKYGMVVILRPGPFIDAEVDFGGFPYWLLRMNSTMKLRTSDPSYLQYVERWYRKVLPMLRDLTYANGGPIITAQVENEYGSYPACDKKYKEFLRNLMIELLGDDVVLLTTDGCGDGMLKCGTVDDVLATCDFGAGGDVKESFKILRKYNPEGPLLNSEFYPGWIDHWGYEWNTVDTQDVLDTIQGMRAMNASFNIYPIRGGTNFGFVAGSNLGDDFQPVTTSYDFDAPLNEAGDPTEKYYRVRKLLAKYVPLPPGPAPKPSPKGEYGEVQVSFVGSVFDHLKDLRSEGPVKSVLPMSFETLKQAYGFVLYRTKIPGRFRDPAKLSIPGLRDRGIVFVDQEPRGILSRTQLTYDMPIIVEPNDTLDILVHNEGRICYGQGISDMKGILGNVTLNKKVLLNWEMFPLDLPNFPEVDATPFGYDQQDYSAASDSKVSGFYSGKFVVERVFDTFLLVKGWTNGYAFINGHNLGRYWPVQGPQQTLYVPRVYLKKGSNNVIELFELERAPCVSDDTCVVRFVGQPFLNGTVPQRRHKQAKPLFKRGH
ncbi:hypothetical protein RvY_10003 [Ramazzottius varieornatus]|uniref:Beta-galactosidase n=1 Tax=Ramazzottius varieornatus TaxID=947166 RepID=A0A1D1VBA5_RAMVA|nr:hypothetical protein RvY_10003 [Ramazzottius varieornatus]